MDLEDKLRHERIWGVKEGIEQGLRQGLEDGRRQGYEMLLRLVRTGAISMETAAEAAGMNEQDFRREMEKNANLEELQ